MLKELWIAACLCSLLGCASRPEVNPPPAPQSPPSLWQGRLSVRVQSDPPQAWSADFELSGTVQSGRLKLSGPLGIQLADLTWTPGVAQLSARGETRYYASLDELASQMNEHALPVEALFGWLNGRTQAVAGWDVQLEPGQRLMARRTEPLPTAELRLIWAPAERSAP